MTEVKAGNSSIQISVVIPCYNHGQFLAETLSSVAAQTIRNWECIVVDNGSTDNTRKVVEEFSAVDKRFRYQYMQQAGVSAARNFGIANAVGQYILPLDADDRIAPSYLEKASKVLDTNPKVKVVYCDAFLFGAASGKWSLPPYSFRELLIENLIFCSALFRKSDFNSVTGYNEQMKEGFEDWDFWIGFLKNGGEVVKIPEPLFFYRIRQKSRNNSLNSEKQLLLRKKIFEHHKETYLQHFTIPELIFDLYTERKTILSLKRSRSYRMARFFATRLPFLKNLLG